VICVENFNFAKIYENFNFSRPTFDRLNFLYFSQIVVDGEKLRMIFNICLLLYDKIDKLVNCLSNYCILPLPVSKGPFIATQLNSTPVLKPDDATRRRVELRRYKRAFMDTAPTFSK